VSHPRPLWQLGLVEFASMTGLDGLAIRLFDMNAVICCSLCVAGTVKN
jgi:hypothetical protein